MDPITIFLLAFFHLNLAVDSEGKCLVDDIHCIIKRTKYMVETKIKESFNLFYT